MEFPLKIHGKKFKIPLNNQSFPDKITVWERIYPTGLEQDSLELLYSVIMEFPLKIHGEKFKIPLNNQGFPDKITVWERIYPTGFEENSLELLYSNYNWVSFENSRGKI